MGMHDLLDDLVDETDELLGVLAGLDDAGWSRPTPSEGWSVLDQVTHLAYFDNCAALAVSDPDALSARVEKLLGWGPDFPDRIAAEHRALSPTKALDWFRQSRADLIATMTPVDPRTRVPWFGPDMSARSSVTARLMETWAHGTDVADAAVTTLPATHRLRHVAHLGVSTFRFSHVVHGEPVPDVSVRVELVSPAGESWTWGPSDAAESVTGPAVDFCLVVTQRRHLDDTDLETRGSHAKHWMSIAQAFAGAAGPGRPRS